ncbi:FlgD immunoglobulin-like domain containing protein [candidate division KSB1 bacterium]
MRTFFTLFLLFLLAGSQATAQVHVPEDGVLFKSAGESDRGYQFIELGKLTMTPRNFGLWSGNYYPLLTYTGISSFGLPNEYGTIRRLFPMVGLRSGPWGADIPTADYGIVDRSEYYNVIESANYTIGGGGQGYSYTDWDAKDNSYSRLMGGEEGSASESGIPYLAVSNRPDSWPEGYYGTPATFSGSGKFTETPGERHWPGRWRHNADENYQHIYYPELIQVINFSEVFMIETDKYCGVRPGDDLNNGYPVGFDLETQFYAFTRPMYEDIIFIDSDLIFQKKETYELEGDIDRHFYNGTIDDIYFGLYIYLRLPYYRVGWGGEYSARPGRIDNYLLWEDETQLLTIYHKYGYHKRQWGTAVEGPVAVFSFKWYDMPGGGDMSSIHYFDERHTGVVEGEPYENWLYAMMSGNVDILKDSDHLLQFFHTYPEDEDYPNYKWDNIDSMDYWNNHDYITGERYDKYWYSPIIHAVDIRPRTQVNVGWGPFSMSPGDTARIEFAVIGSADNPGIADPANYNWPVNDPFYFGVDPKIRFEDVYNNAENADIMYGFLSKKNVEPVLESTNFDYSFRLDPNYPNPFNPSTTIRFNLPYPEDVTVKIYNVLGGEVKTLAAGSFARGEHELVWDGTNNSGITVSTGIYFCKIYAGRFSSMIRMMLIK